VSPVLHPSWCSLSLCDVVDPNIPPAGGSHRSAPVTIGVGPMLLFSTGCNVRHVEASLSKVAAAWETDTYLTLRADETEAVFPVDVASAALGALGNILEAAR
jgi:hypothetical protein